MEYVLLLLIIGLLIYVISDYKERFGRLEDRFRDLNRRMDDLKRTEAQFPKAADVQQAPVHFKPQPVAEQKVLEKPVEVKPVPNPVIPIVPKQPERPIAITQPLSQEIPTKQEAPKPYIAQKSWWENFKEQNPDLEKFIGENIINKIGVLILVLGISYLVKYAIDKDWINEPARVGVGILSGAIVMGFAHKLKRNFAAFSSVLVAGAISIFYFTIAIAFHEYALFSQTVAFVIMVVITGFSAFISLSYNKLELAVLSLIGGFAVPFMISTGAGNYAVLFTYIAILDVGILALAYHKKWGLINILSYIFTVVLFGGWLFQDLNSELPHYGGALLFAFAFYLIFILINIINNLRTKGNFTATELSILASNSFLFYAAGMAILSKFHPELRGGFTTLLGLLNFGYAWFLYKKFGLDKNAVYLLIGLTLTFITLAVPIQFEGNYITLFWAAEGIVLMWLAQKSNISFYRFVSVIVHFLMLISLTMDFSNIYDSEMVLDIIINPAFMTAAFSLLSLFAVSWLIRNETDTFKLFGFSFNCMSYRKYVLIILIILGYCTGLLETIYQSFDYIENNYTAYSLPVLYHLLFGSVFISLIPKTERYKKIALTLALLNIVLYVFLFSRIPFSEHENYIETGIYQRLAFYLHYVLLALTIYQALALYKMNRENAALSILKNRFITFFAAFLIIYAASSELMLHGLVVSNDPITIAEINAQKAAPEFGKYDDTDFIKSVLASNKIEVVKSQIIKTGYPILWGVLAFIFLIAGIRRKWKDVRIIALLLLGITILKLFIFDIRNASETGKIVAFILLGVLILIISFVYQKLKILVIDENPELQNESKPETDENQ